MKKLHFDYSMQIDYSEPVSKCFYTIKCLPKDSMRQRVENSRIELTPESVCQTGTDGFGNSQIYGVNETPHQRFCFQISGDAVTGLAPYEEEGEDSRVMVFRHPFGLNKAGTQIKRYFDRVQPKEEEDPYRKAIRLMNRLYRDFRYQSGSTTVATTAEEAFTAGRGVCQDYAHIFIALMHLAGIPARYVTGLIIGEGASHAWVEIRCGGKWYGLDPTNNILVCDDHIRIGCGRDAGDCMINRGIMHGGGAHSQTIKVNVKEY